MRSQELRSAFVEFFSARGHKNVRPASLVPSDVLSSTLFTIAGMEQFVPAFLGDEPPPALNVVTVQRCLRVAGAKSDIENVGRTGRHGTFLEMLGNFSFGGYYKSEAIRYAWDFLTGVLRLDPSRLAVTVHTSDDEADRVWRQEIGVPAQRITRFDEDNFWTMGPTGPCGPSTEIFYDTGAENASGPDDVGPNTGNRFVEIWNVVFQQYNRDAAGKLEELPRKQIDTGAGLERMLAVVNSKRSMYETDLFTDLIDAQPQVSAPAFRSQEKARERDERRNIIADHARAVTFLVNDGVYPSNTDRGYVLRFLIRRAIRNGKMLGYPDGFFGSLMVPAAVASLASGYPELNENVAGIQSAVRTEEATFDRTLERGMSMLDEILSGLAPGQALSGQDVFTLHDTYGFPVELTREIAAERGIAIDHAGFEQAMNEQRERARRDAAAKRAVVSVAELPATRSEFLGYEGLEADGAIVAMIKDGNLVEELHEGDGAQLILDRTSFYAEKGGQIGDRGVITLGTARFEVSDTQMQGEAVAHSGSLRSGTLRTGEVVHTQVYPEWRREIRRHHTSAHLLQRALKDVLGDEISQAGSWVGIDRMRFDFRSPSGALTPAQKREIAQRVNEMIRDDTPLETRVLPIEEARSSGAIMMSGEKYGDRVRVVHAGPSVEFCGGTHAHSTGELGLFVILSEFSIGSGIRRIESCVSRSAEEYTQRQAELVGDLAASLATTPDELGERIGKLQREVRDLQNAVGELKSRLAAADAQTYVERAEREGGRTFIGAVVPEASGEALRHLSSAIRQRLRSGVIALAGVDDGTVSLLVSASQDMVQAGVHAGNLVKLAAPLVGGRGGGQPAQAQGGGKNPGGAHEAVQAIRQAVLSA
ncbi:MAG TPA: alanine--tRNA ligase [Candidatus Baltobacteraceae bacterium]|jgi:alanyl-tRNA synthetase|nr:alanine--tRNA ligase [Candidatus Baltobacteraceae bacterium]